MGMKCHRGVVVNLIGTVRHQVWKGKNDQATENHTGFHLSSHCSTPSPWLIRTRWLSLDSQCRRKAIT